ncbi:metallophosphoesterase [Bacillus sp. FJAT-42376]|uniref:metallophosphoesterase family protein n=1 Tax=Bacillus sp. FJAT-42376 TaxID=2014076 RepID=UPI000F4DFA90|nr:metallophosphoesterase [Bacillus sp. FJAT-42376]AZB41340.1 metallophosphoesterase [Bacillus sp. FJAT-42376]
MKLLVLSDTHIPKRSKAYPDRLLEELKQADAILHAGDFLTADAYHELCGYGMVYAVYGNADNEDVKSMLPDKQLLKMNGFTIGLIHGHEGKGRTTEKRALNAFQDQKLDCLIFGHSHIPVHKQEGDLLLFNPGSPTDKRRQPFFSYGILTLEQELRAEHIFFEKGSVKPGC